MRKTPLRSGSWKTRTSTRSPLPRVLAWALARSAEAASSAEGRGASGPLARGERQPARLDTRRPTRRQRGKRADTVREPRLVAHGEGEHDLVAGQVEGRGGAAGVTALEAVADTDEEPGEHLVVGVHRAGEGPVAACPSLERQPVVGTLDADDELLADARIGPDVHPVVARGAVEGHGLQPALVAHRDLRAGGGGEAQLAHADDRSAAELAQVLGPAHVGDHCEALGELSGDAQRAVEQGGRWRGALRVAGLL